MEEMTWDQLMEEKSLGSVPNLSPNLIRCTKSYRGETGMEKAQSGVGTGLGAGTDQGLTSI